MIEETFTLLGDATPVQLEESGITLIAPGLMGSGTAHPRPVAGGGRASIGERDTLALAIAESGADDRYTLSIEAPTPAAGGAGRSGVGGVAADEVLLQVPLARDEAAYLMYVDESGVISYHFAESAAETPRLPSRAFGAASQSSFHIPLRRAESRGGGDGRGLFAKVTSKIIKVIVVKLFPDVVGGATARIVRAWEEKFRAHGGLHGGTWADLFAAIPSPIEDISPAAGRRSLLLIHGTTSTTAGAFAGLQQQEALLKRLHTRYDGRIYGFNHHTLSRGVAENVRDLLASFRRGGPYTFDIICHSRGGLVARAFAAAAREHGASLSGIPCAPAAGVQLAVDRIAFVATPNAGTIMAEPKGIPGLVERLTNVVNQLPDSALTIAIGALTSLAGAAVEAAIPRLPGLADQVPSSDLQGELGAAAGASDRYFALASEYQPTGGLVDAIKRKAVDTIFGEVPNDLVVPTAGVATTQYFKLPAERVIQFEPGRGVHHSAYFQQPEMGRVVEWLEGE